jgi:ABC-2 type transport system ATP-binding protein
VTVGPSIGPAAERGVPPAIAVEGLVKRYGTRTVVDDVTLTVVPGEIVALLGPNGAGKTTTLEIIEGYRTADGGMVRVLGTEPSSGGREHRARVGIMLQDGGFDIRARPAETIDQYARFHAEPRDPGELLDLVGLRTVASTPYRRLSGGERQRLGLAVALVGRPDVVVLDEPTAGMDPEARSITRGLIADLRASGIAILLTSHDLVDVERLADRIAVLVAGRIVASGPVADVIGGAGSLEDAYLRLVRGGP